MKQFKILLNRCEAALEGRLWAELTVYSTMGNPPQLMTVRMAKDSSGYWGLEMWYSRKSLVEALKCSAEKLFIE